MTTTTRRQRRPSGAQEFAHGTWLAPESHAYPNGAQTRRGLALWPDGQLRAVRAGLPDTFFSIPAHGRQQASGRERYVAGWLGVDDGLRDCPDCRAQDKPWQDCPNRGNGEGGQCDFGRVDSLTRGALLFHPTNLPA